MAVRAGRRGEVDFTLEKQGIYERVAAVGRRVFDASGGGRAIRLGRTDGGPNRP
ncbi:MAG: hypothetical protein AVDCRST_MAG64-3963 [uncultured Phycisphaerae bacterium]|uniref:Uncharacterized protein n=1 Tax=uncultured Phycisphaerae bacterium TaxID=904963 RepID=A0A6J4QIX9_9BACT|nr:MAG: hypothetical protein AVDCRST_MAG64-3963 [uncultured Phycisphaerae bacterium]